MKRKIYPIRPSIFLCMFLNSDSFSQVIGSVLPVSMIAIFLSSVLAKAYMPNINNLIFRSIGAMKNNMEISLPILLLFASVQMIVSYGISIWLCMPIRKISVYTLIKE